MITEIAAGLTSLKAAADLMKAVNGVLKANEVAELKFTLTSHIIEAQHALLLAQQGQTTSANRIHDLEQEIVRMKDWSAEREHYELREVSGGAFAYVKNAAMQGDQPVHWLCTHCFETGKKSILQLQGVGKSPSWYEHSCPACGSKISIWREMKIRRNIMD